MTTIHTETGDPWEGYVRIDPDVGSPVGTVLEGWVREGDGPDDPLLDFKVVTPVTVPVRGGPTYVICPSCEVPGLPWEESCYGCGLSYVHDMLGMPTGQMVRK